MPDADADAGDADALALFRQARERMAEARRHSATLDAELADLKGRKKALTDERAEWHAVYMKWAAVCDGSAPPPQPELPGLDGGAEGDGGEG